MKAINGKIDYINASIPSIYLKLGLPILISSVTSIFVSILQTQIIRNFCPEYFAISAVVNIIFTILTSIGSSVASASWMTCAASFASKDADSKKNLYNVVCLIFASQLCVELLALIFTDPILKLINTPAEIYQDVRLFYILYILVSVFSAFAALVTTLISGLTSPISILLTQLATQIFPCLATAVYLGIFQMGLVGGALLVGTGAALTLLLGCFILFKTKSCELPKKEDRKLDISLCVTIVKRSMALFLQALFCNLGYLAVTAQTNKYLSLDYISVLSINIPITSAFSVFSTVAAVTLPQNYAMGHHKRTRKILFGAALYAQLYGIFCFAFYALVGRAYYATLFDSVSVIEMGAQYWFYYGMGFAVIPALYVLRDFYIVVDKPMITLGSGICELAGNLFCAYVLIPHFGNVGRSLSYTVGWGVAAIYLWVVYLILRKKIFFKEES